MRLVCVTLIIFFGLISFSTALAQETTGSLEGFILDQDGQPLPGALITVTSPTLQGSRTAISRSNGYFTLPHLPGGSYLVRVTKESFGEVSIEDVSVRLGRTTGVGELLLADEAYILEDLVVYGGSMLIDPVSTGTGYNFSANEFENLPFDRDYANMMEFLPHANRGFYGTEGFSTEIDFGGATHLENRYFVDGVEATEPFWGEYGMALPPNFVQEVQVRSGAYQAEYRSALGGVVDVITPSGSNEFRGEAFVYYTDNRMTGDQRLPVGEAPPVGDFQSYDFGLGVGGPLMKDKLWYFAALNPTFSGRDVEIPTLGIYPDEKRSLRFAGKLTWRINVHNDLMLSAVGAPSSRNAVWNWIALSSPFPDNVENPDMYLQEINDQNYVFSLKGLHWLGDNILLESSASLHHQLYEEVPRTEIGKDEAFFIDMETLTFSGGTGGYLRNDFNTADLGVKGSIISDKHTLKGGLQYRDRFGAQDASGWSIERWVDPDTGEETYFENIWTDSAGNPITHNRIYSAFIQDSWRAGGNLRLNLGLRWDGQRIIGSDGNVGLSILDQWQPRLGFTHLHGAQGSRKFFGNYGRYYQELSGPIPSLFREGGYPITIVYDHDPRVDPTGGTVVYEGASSVFERIEGLEGQYYDEFTLGYEQAVGGKRKLSIRGIYRRLGNGVESCFVDDTDYVVGNPGHGDLAEFPELKREYMALEFTFQATPSPRTGLLASYTLSKNHGNYTGLQSTDYGSPYPNLTETFDFLVTTVNSDGLLPNDRTHTLKLSGWYRTGFRLTVGATGWWMSGTPINEFGSAGITSYHTVFLSERGSAGRTPSIWDLNLRFAYDLPLSVGGMPPRIFLDLMHVGSPREAVLLDQQLYFGVDDEGNPNDLNPDYGAVRRYQPPMVMRLGMKMGF